MTADDLRKALEGYSPAFESKLVEHITSAIAQASMTDDSSGNRLMVIRTGEIAGALTTCLASTLALSPAVTRTPRAIRELSEKIRRKIERQVRRAERDSIFADFKSRTFNETDRDRGGSA